MVPLLSPRTRGLARSAAHHTDPVPPATRTCQPAGASVPVLPTAPPSLVDRRAVDRSGREVAAGTGHDQGGVRGFADPRRCGQRAPPAVCTVRRSAWIGGAWAEPLFAPSHTIRNYLAPGKITKTCCILGLDIGILTARQGFHGIRLLAEQHRIIRQIAPAPPQQSQG